jgi:hypothetical protein
VTASGQPDMLIKNIPRNRVSEIKIDSRKSISRADQQLLLTNTDELEFDYPSSGGEEEDNAISTMKEMPDVKLNVSTAPVRHPGTDLSCWYPPTLTATPNHYQQIYYAEGFRRSCPSSSTIQIRTFVTADGKLYWIIDADTTSSYYPYSTV